MKYIKCFIVLVCVLFFYPLLASSDFHLKFYNVGQGNCILLKSLDSKKAILIDGGSSSIPGKNEPEKSRYKNDKIKEITRLLRKASLIEFYIIVTHGDIDHYSWILDIISDNRIKGKVEKVICGGAKKDYSGTFVKAMTSLKAEYIIDDNISIEYLHREYQLSSKDFTFEFLSASNNPKQDKNDLSIVTKATWYGKSALLTGDATGKVMDELPTNKLKADVFLASHHGSSTHKTNSRVLLEKVNPEISFLVPAFTKAIAIPMRRLLVDVISNYNLQRIRTILFITHRPQPAYLSSPH